MKAIKQLLRQPLKTAIGMILMTLAAAIVCLCLGQAMAAQATKEALNRQFCTVGIPTVQKDVNGWVHLSSYLLEDDFLAWLERVAAQHPDVVQGTVKSGILSAHIPELTPYNPTALYYEAPVVSTKIWDYSFDEWLPAPFNMPYSSAMMVITLEEIGEPESMGTRVLCEPDLLQREDFSSQQEYNDYYASLEWMTEQTGYEITLVGTVTQTVALQEGYRNIVGRTARLALHVPTLEALAELNLVLGEQYIVYGMDFVDEHGKLVDRIEGVGLLPRGTMEPYNPDLLKIEEQVSPPYISTVIKYGSRRLSESDLEQLNTITMTLTGPTSLLQFEEIRGEDGYLQELVEKGEYTLTDADGQTITLSKEEYAQRYQIPRIARLEGSVEDFLNSQEGEIWKAALERTQINNHAFAVVGVDRLDYLGEFSLKRSQIVEGRDFTPEERKNGMRVCVVNELLAYHAGLSVGDTITLNLYRTDNNLPYQSFRKDGSGILNPTASFYFDTTPFTETAEYTIVGIWRGEAWPDVKEDPYAFSANTVFVPRSSVQTPMEECDTILLNALVLENGKIEAFHTLAQKAGYAGRFKYNDQGYSTIAVNFHNYDDLARQMLNIGAVLYAVLLLLFLLLYPGSQRKNIRTMRSFGAGYFRRFGYIVVSSLGIVLPASLLGGWLGQQLWDRLVEALQTTAESAVALQLQPGALTAVALAQLLFALMLTVFVALFVAAPRSISQRR